MGVRDRSGCEGGDRLGSAGDFRLLTTGMSSGGGTSAGGKTRLPMPIRSWPGRFSAGGGVECGDADEVVDGGGHLEPRPVAFLADVAEFASSPDGLDPSEGLLDSFTDPLGDVISGVAGGAPIDGGSPVGGVLSDMGCEPDRSDVGNEVLGVIVLVAGHGPTPAVFGEPFEHLDGAVSFGEPGGSREFGVDDQPGTMLDQQMPGVTQLGGGVVRFAIQPG